MSDGNGSPLSRKQLDIVRLLADGFTHKEIAIELNTTMAAVEVSVRRARAATLTHNGVELVALALRKGWIS